jgi:hypothetical protein
LSRRERRLITREPSERIIDNTRMPIQNRHSEAEMVGVTAILVVVERVLEVSVLIDGELRIWFEALKFVG